MQENLVHIWENCSQEQAISNSGFTYSYHITLHYTTFAFMKSFDTFKYFSGNL